MTSGRIDIRPIPASDHFDGRRFFNPDHPSTDRSLIDVARWKLQGGAIPWPKAVPAPQMVPDRTVEGLHVTFVGHATALIQAGGLNILTDPVWSERASPVRFAGPRRICRPGIAFHDLPQIDIILVSHNHYDHLDIATLRQLHRRFRPLMVTPLGNGAIIRRAIPGARVEELDWHEGTSIGEGARVDVVPAYHWSGRGLADRRRALWGGFMLRTPQGRVYFAGDTGYGSGDIFRAIRARYGAPDIALIPIGCYAPGWFMAAQHTDPEEAVEIMRDMDARLAIGIHWGVFQLSDEAWDEPARRLEQALHARGVAPGRFRAGTPGDVFQPQPATTLPS